MMEAREPTRAWRPVDPRRAGELVDARLQLHHAAQLVAAFGICYLPAQADDSHTNMEWLAPIIALASQRVGQPGTGVAVQLHPFALLVLDADNTVVATSLLDGASLDGAARWLREQLARRGFDSARYTLERHYEIPHHRVADGAAFDAAGDRLDELANWYSNADSILRQVVVATPNASPVRCWPHHFDIATLLEVAPGKTISLGMEPGDDYWREPYFYASMSPAPPVHLPRSELAGDGVWNTRDWIGAALPGSRLTASTQRAQIADFISAAVRACTELLLQTSTSRSV
jgi:hypothetical protein